MSTASRKNLQSQTGASLLGIFLILIVVAVGMAAVGMTLTRKMIQRHAQQSSPAGWQVYKSEKYGYSVSYPKDWQVEDKSTDSSRKVDVFDPKGNAYVDVSAFKDESMKDAAAIQTALSAMETKLRSDSTLTVQQFKGQAPKPGEKVGGYIAVGQETIKGIAFNFDNRGLLDTYGKIILFHSAVKKELAKDYNPILSQIIKSFKVE